MFLYFQIQFKILNRRFSDFGLPPIIAYILLPMLFTAASNQLFTKTHYAIYAYYFIVFSLVLKLSDRKRNDFLKSCYNRINYYKLRFLENVVVSIPFILFLIYKFAFLSVIITIAIALVMAIINFNVSFNYTIPTPFYKTPFEFTVGFRKTVILFPLAYTLTVISVYVNNFNLGIASIVLLFLVCISYYSKTEPKYYVWSFNLSPNLFLNTKIKTAIYHASILVIPSVAILCFCFYKQFFLILLFLLLGYVFLITVLLAKYSSYPNTINLPQSILIVLCVFFPPLLVIVLPYFYNRSLKALQLILK